jgi:hypothetical protein
MPDGTVFVAMGFGMELTVGEPLAQTHLNTVAFENGALPAQLVDHRIIAHYVGQPGTYVIDPSTSPAMCQDQAGNIQVVHQDIDESNANTLVSWTPLDVHRSPRSLHGEQGTP